MMVWNFSPSALPLNSSKDNTRGSVYEPYCTSLKYLIAVDTEIPFSLAI